MLKSRSWKNEKEKFNLIFSGRQFHMRQISGSPTYILFLKNLYVTLKPVIFNSSQFKQKRRNLSLSGRGIYIVSPVNLKNICSGRSFQITYYLMK